MFLIIPITILDVKCNETGSIRPGVLCIKHLHERIADPNFGMTNTTIRIGDTPSFYGVECRLQEIDKLWYTPN